jgi:ADP-ribose pyrophosphatase YjhB (NUDIX family)
MKLIKVITDKDVLGTDGLSTAKPRLTARAILKNHKNQYAVMYSSEFDLYSFPGGGIEEGENVEDALKREIVEETGCDIEKIDELGYIEENRAHCDYTQVSYYFIVTTNSEQFNPNLTQNELRHGTTVGWLSITEAYNNIAYACHTTNQRKFLQARDVAALEEYLKEL